MGIGELLRYLLLAALCWGGLWWFGVAALHTDLGRLFALAGMQGFVVWANVWLLILWQLERQVFAPLAIVHVRTRLRSRRSVFLTTLIQCGYCLLAVLGPLWGLGLWQGDMGTTIVNVVLVFGISTVLMIIGAGLTTFAGAKIVISLGAATLPVLLDQAGTGIFALQFRLVVFSGLLLYIGATMAVATLKRTG